MDITTDQRLAAALRITNNRGEAAPVEGAPVWASSDETVLVVTPADDGMSASINTVGAGTARISVTADADLGEGVAQITGVSEDVNVTVGPNSIASTVAIDLAAVDK